METWYKTSRWGQEKIEPVDVIKETPKQVVVWEKRFSYDGKNKLVESRHRKESSYDNYFKTYQEAYDFILNKKTMVIEGLMERLRNEKKGLTSFVRNYNRNP